MTTFIIALLVLSVIVMVHEFGHFLVARLTGIYAQEFSIGMGPRLVKIAGKETEYSIRALPIGGYVRFLGEDDQSDDPRAFSNAKLWKRMAVVVSGPGMNFLLAIILLIFMYMHFGIAVSAPIVGNIIEGSPSEEAGFQIGDRIVEIDNIPIQEENSEQAIQLIRSIIQKAGQLGNETIPVTVERNGKIAEITVKPEWHDQSQEYLIGIHFYKIQRLGFFQSAKTAFTMTGNVIVSMVDALGNLIFKQQGIEQVMGPVGIVNEIGEAARAGIQQLIILAIVITINLGIINLIPFPALDGGRFVLMVVEGLRGKPIDPRKEGYIHLVGFVLLILMMFFFTYKDITR